VFLLREPGKDRVRDFLATEGGRPFSYEHVGATRATPPARHVVDHNRIRLGEGPETWRRAVLAMRAWTMFRLGWVRLLPEAAPLEPGVSVAIVVRLAPLLWSLNTARIVYTVDEPDRFAFAYGTLPAHAEQGEERFTIERLSDGSVWYDILAFSRPQHPLVWLGYPVTRALQRRFARDSMRAMVAAVQTT
jgi:uncharacterized protein (UPF0548 family)